MAVATPGMEEVDLLEDYGSAGRERASRPGSGHVGRLRDLRRRSRGTPASAEGRIGRRDSGGAPDSDGESRDPLRTPAGTRTAPRAPLSEPVGAQARMAHSQSAAAGIGQPYAQRGRVSASAVRRAQAERARIRDAELAKEAELAATRNRMAGPGPPSGPPPAQGRKMGPGHQGGTMGHSASAAAGIGSGRTGYPAPSSRRPRPAVRRFASGSSAGSSDGAGAAWDDDDDDDDDDDEAGFFDARAATGAEHPTESEVYYGSAHRRRSGTGSRRGSRTSADPLLGGTAAEARQAARHSAHAHDRAVGIATGIRPDSVASSENWSSPASVTSGGGRPASGRRGVSSGGRAASGARVMSFESSDGGEWGDYGGGISARSRDTEDGGDRGTHRGGPPARAIPSGPEAGGSRKETRDARQQARVRSAGTRQTGGGRDESGAGSGRATSAGTRRVYAPSSGADGSPSGAAAHDGVRRDRVSSASRRRGQRASAPAAHPSGRGSASISPQHSASRGPPGKELPAGPRPFGTSGRRRSVQRSLSVSSQESDVGGDMSARSTPKGPSARDFAEGKHMERRHPARSGSSQQDTRPMLQLEGDDDGHLSVGSFAGGASPSPRLVGPKGAAHLHSPAAAMHARAISGSSRGRVLSGQVESGAGDHTAHAERVGFTKEGVGRSVSRERRHADEAKYEAAEARAKLPAAEGDSKLDAKVDVGDGRTQPAASDRRGLKLTIDDHMKRGSPKTRRSKMRKKRRPAPASRRAMQRALSHDGSPSGSDGTPLAHAGADGRAPVGGAQYGSPENGRPDPRAGFDSRPLLDDMHLRPPSRDPGGGGAAPTQDARPGLDLGGGSFGSTAGAGAKPLIDVGNDDSFGGYDKPGGTAGEGSLHISEDGTMRLPGMDGRIRTTGLSDSFKGAAARGRPRKRDIRSELVLLEGDLGKGASGVVCKAVHLPTLQLVAVKHVRIHDKEKRTQMVRELKTLYQNIVPIDAKAPKATASPAPMAASPFVVEFYDAYTAKDAGMVSIVMEYMNGGSLQGMVESGGCRDEGTLASIAYQALEGLAFLHARHQIHRDIKPANLLRSLDGRVKLADFGIARQLADTWAQAKTFVGTLIYMAPERIESEAYSYPSDIWSLGLSLLTIAHGEFPYSTSGGYWTLSRAIKDDPAPVVKEGFSDEFRDFVGQMLEKSPMARPRPIDLLDHPFVAEVRRSFRYRERGSTGVVARPLPTAAGGGAGGQAGPDPALSSSELLESVIKAAVEERFVAFATAFTAPKRRRSVRYDASADFEPSTSGSLDILSMSKTFELSENDVRTLAEQVNLPVATVASCVNAAIEAQLASLGGGRRSAPRGAVGTFFSPTKG